MSRDPATVPATDSTLASGRAWAWGICWLMFASTVLNYMDRQAVAVVGEKITGEFRIRFEDLGWIIAAFQVSYALFQVPAGYLVDRGDVRWIYAGAVLWWSASAIAVALSPTLGMLMVFRAVLGFGESFNWPCALKVTGTILPATDRSLGNGIFNSGAAVGAVVTPLVVTPLTVWFGWRVAFIAIGMMGFFWVVGWLLATGGVHRATFRRSVVANPEPTRRSGMSGLARGVFGGLVVAALGLAVLGWNWTVAEPLRLPEGTSPARAIELRVAVGNDVRVKDVVAELRTDAGAVPVVASGSGRVVEIPVVALGELTGGTPLLILERQPYRLSGIWMAVALVMIGALLISRLLPMRALEGADWARSLGEITRRRRFWVLVAVSVTVNVCWHFLVNWLPTYLKTDRGMAFVAGSLLSALPFLAADVGNLGGGALSRWLVGRGLAPARARQLVMLGCVFLISPGALVGLVRDNSLTLALLAVMALGTAAFMANYFAFCQEVDPRATGLIVGILGGLGNLFAAGFAPVVGQIKDQTGGFGPVFVIVGLLPFVGLAALLLGWGQSREEPGAV